MSTYTFDLTRPTPELATSGLSGPESEGRWTDGQLACLTLELGEATPRALLLILELRPYISPNFVPEQWVEVVVNGTTVARWSFREELFRKRIVAVERANLPASGKLELELHVPTCAQPAALNEGPDARFLGVMLRSLTVQGVTQLPPDESLIWQFGRPVGGEAAKSFDRHIESGFWSCFVQGPNVLDIGFRGYGGTVLPILEGAIGVDLDYPGYDGRTLPFPDNSQDAVFSSHCLEHIPGHLHAIQDWFRVTRVGGHIITAVPNAQLYERRRRPPSRWNDDHQRFYTPASLLAEFEAALAANSYRVRYLEENDTGYRYDLPLDIHPFGCYEIILVVQKIRPPAWRLEE